MSIKFYLIVYNLAFLKNCLPNFRQETKLDTQFLWQIVSTTSCELEKKDSFFYFYYQIVLVCWWCFYSVSV